MLNQERKEMIITEVDTKGFVKMQDLAMVLNASESTIRRDLTELEAEGLVNRVHGGARQVQKIEKEPTMAEKTFINIQSKAKIASFASGLIEDGENIYLDAGTTTFEMIPLLSEKKISVVTNSVLHANRLIDVGVSVVVIGGTIKPSTKATVGLVALQQLSRLKVDKAFMGMNGVDVEFGYTTPEVEEAAMKQAAMELATESFVLVDSSKIGVCCFAKVEALNRATIITDECPIEIRSEVKKQTNVLEACR